MKVPLTRRRLMESAAGFATSFLFAGRRAIASSHQPNIVLVVADDVGTEILQPYGSDFYRTPRLMNLAKQGLLFHHCYATPLCTPSRLELMTGKYNHRNYRTFSSLPKTEKTFANILKQAGYKTCIVGKWQLRRSEGQLPEEAGFDEYSLSPAPNASEGTPTGNGFYWFPKVNENGTWRQTRSSDYGPDLSLAYLLDFMERHQSTPFFAYYALHLPHGPFDATPKSADTSLRKDLSVFPDMVAYLDFQMGQILDQLNRLRIRRNTIFIFTSDNGSPERVRSPYNGEIVQGGKGLLNDRGTKVPCIISWPGTIAKGKQTQVMIDFTDFLPTLAEIAGIQPSTLEEIDGKSFLAFLEGQTPVTKGYAFTYYFNKPGTELIGYWARTQRWKLYDNGNLYDIKNDPEEQSPIRSSEDSERTQQVRTRLEKIFTSVGL